LHGLTFSQKLNGCLLLVEQMQPQKKEGTRIKQATNASSVCNGLLLNG